LALENGDIEAFPSASRRDNPFPDFRRAFVFLT
jgi:hypothetical protein